MFEVENKEKLRIINAETQKKPEIGFVQTI